MIRNYDDFCAELLKAGFSVASGGNDEGVFGLIKHGWDKQPPDSPLRWHTGDPETDPWEWRMRVLDERGDIAYGKVFFKKAGYITKEWYPYFLATRRPPAARRPSAARRGVASFAEDYSDGVVSHNARRIYDAVAEHGALPLHEIKQFSGFSRGEKSKFDAALTELQMKLYLTMCGRQQKISQKGEGYGWSSTVFCTSESFWGADLFKIAADIGAREAADKITAQVLRLNPSAGQKRINKFIGG
ncbi:MAG: hypothetical protein FWH06_03965 [Oscillospiraceae bacterium]|nr:hypothetical protein [Oscillospiraceae bacterium]